MQRLPPTLLCLALALSACAPSEAPPRQLAQATPPVSDAPPALTLAAPTDPTDPYEATNRRVLDFNFALDEAVLKPVAEGYREVLGPWPRARIRNVLQNLNEPSVFANRVMQGKPIEAGTSLMRFVINTTLGLGGLFDLESIGGPPKQVADFGQTLAGWGVGDGPYLMLPVVGPSNPRELTGTIVNGLLNPVNYAAPVAAGLGRSAALGLDERERNIETIDELRTGSLDTYARLRSLWQQHRNAELGRAAPAEPDVLDDPGEDAPVAAPAARPAPKATAPARAERRPVAHPPRKVAAKKKPPQRQLVAARASGRRG